MDNKQPMEKWGRLRKLSNANPLVASMNLSLSSSGPLSSPASPSNNNSSHLLSPNKLSIASPSQNLHSEPFLSNGVSMSSSTPSSFNKIVSPKEIHSPRPKNDSSERVMSNYEASRLYFKQSLSAAKNNSSSSIPMNINTTTSNNYQDYETRDSTNNSRAHDSASYSTPRRQDYLDSQQSLRTPLSASAVTTSKHMFMSSPNYRDASYSSSSLVNASKFNRNNTTNNINSSPILSSGSSTFVNNNNNNLKLFNNQRNKPSRPVLNSSSSFNSFINTSCAVCSQLIHSHTNNAALDRIVELRCECVVHEDCLLSAVRFEKEKEKQQGNSLNNNQLHILDRVFPICLHCGGSTKTVPKNNMICEYFINEFLQYDHLKNNSASSKILQAPSSPYLNQQSQSQGQLRRLQQSPQFVLSPSSSTSSASSLSSQQVKQNLYYMSKLQQQPQHQSHYGHGYNHHQQSSHSFGNTQESGNNNVNRLHLNTNTSVLNSPSNSTSGQATSAGNRSNPYQNINSPSNNKASFKSPISSSSANNGLGMPPGTSSCSFSNNNNNAITIGSSAQGTNGNGRIVSPLMLANNPYIRNTLGESSTNLSNYHGHGHSFENFNNNGNASENIETKNPNLKDSLGISSPVMHASVTANSSPTTSSHSLNYRYVNSGSKPYLGSSPSIKSPLGILSSSVSSPIHGSSINGSMMRQPFLDSPRSHEFSKSEKSHQHHPLPPTPLEQQYYSSNLRVNSSKKSSSYNSGRENDDNDNISDDNEEDDIIAAYDNVSNYNYLDSIPSKNIKMDKTKVQNKSDLGIPDVSNNYGTTNLLNNSNNSSTLATSSARMSINNSNINMDIMQSIKAKRVAPAPPLTGEERSKHISSVISKNKTNISSPSKSQSKSNSIAESSSNGNGVTSISSKAANNLNTPERTKSMHSLSFDILNGPSKSFISNNNEINNIPKLPDIQAVENNSVTESIVSPTSSQDSQSNTTDPNVSESLMKRSDSITSSLLVSTSNTQSQKDDDDFYDDADSEDEYPLDIIQSEFTNYLKTNLKDAKTDKLVLTDTMLSEFGDLRLVDKLLVLINNAEKSKFKKSVVYLFENRLLLVDLGYKLFISLKLNLPEKEPSVEIISTSVIKLDFQKTTSASSKSRSIQSTYISIDESQNDVIQKWCAALFDYECSLPGLIFTSTLNELMESFISNNIESQDVVATDKFLLTSLNTYDSNVHKKENSLTPHNKKTDRSSQVTLGSTLFDGTASRISILSNNTSRQQSRVNSVLYTIPKSLLIIANVATRVTGSQVSLLINILKTISFKIPNMKVVATKHDFQTEMLSENCKSSSFMQKLIKVMTNYDSSSHSNFILENYLREDPEISVLYLSCNAEFLNPVLLQSFSPKAKLIQVGVHDSQYKSLLQNSTKLTNDVINVPIWDNLMEAICGTYHITFDNFIDNDSSDSDSEGKDEHNWSNMDVVLTQEPSINIEEEENGNNSGCESSSESSSESDSRDSDGYDSDDSTKLQLLRLKKEGQLGDDDHSDELLKKYNLDSAEYDDHVIDRDLDDEGDDLDEEFSSYEESEDSDANSDDLECDSDDSTREQLARLNQKELLEKIESKKLKNTSANATSIADESTTMDGDMSYSNQILKEIEIEEEVGDYGYGSDFDTSYLISKIPETRRSNRLSNCSFANKNKSLLDPIMFEDESVQLEEDNFKYDTNSNNNSNIGTPKTSARRFTRENSPRPIVTTTPQKGTDLGSKLGTPRWSTLFQDIDKEWLSLKNNEDGGFMKFSQWKNLENDDHL